MPALETFVEPDVQPSVKDCEELQKPMHELEELISVYKFFKLEKEISPSFNIHAKVSEKEIPPNEIPELKMEAAIEEEHEAREAVRETLRPEPLAALKPIAVGINDKFRFINAMFNFSTSEYEAAIEQLNNMDNFSDADIYLNSLKHIYHWNEHHEVVKLFYATVKKRFV